MKIWHQGFVDFGKTPVYRASFERHLAAVIPSEATVVLHGLKPGTFGESYTPIEALAHPYIARLLDNQICEAALTAEAAGYDAVAINCFYDPGLREARTLVDIPVVSLFETCLLTACSLGKSVGMIALNEDQCEKHRELAAAYGMSERLAATVPMSPGIDEYMLEADAEAARPIFDGFRRACETLVAAGAEVIVPGDGVLNDFVWRHRLDAGGATLMDAAGTLIHHAAYLVGLRRSLGTSISRCRHFPRPPAAMLDHFRALDGRQGEAEAAYSGRGEVRRQVIGEDKVVAI